MKPNFAIISDCVKKTMGGIENHASILTYLLKSHGYAVTPIDYQKLRPRQIKGFDVVVIEGIHRLELMKIMMAKKKNDMILFTHGSFYLNSPERKELRMFDSSRHKTMKLMFDKIFMKVILNKFDKIITLSEPESKDIATLFGLNPEKFSPLEVFSDEISEESTSENNIPKYFFSEYLCYVGRLDSRKNLLSLLEASRSLDMPLLVAGQDQGILSELQDYCRANGFNKFQYLGIVSRNEKMALIKNSSLLVIPSFFEGTPATAIEGLKLGKIVVMTCNSYMPEHPCIHTTQPDSQSLIIAIKESLVSKGCSEGFISNEEIIGKFLEIIDKVQYKK